MASSGPEDKASGVQLHPPSTNSKYIVFPLPLAPHTTVHIRITPLETSSMIFLTTTDYATTSTTSPLGSFIYAMPNRLNPPDVLSTAIIPVPSSIDFATRVAKIVARKTGKPTYVGCSASFGGATVEEELEGVRAVIEAIMGELKP